MHNTILKTPIDDMVEILKEKKICSIKYIQEKLNVSTGLLEKWLTILEEYNVLTVFYRGLEGFAKIKEEVAESTKKGNNPVNAMHDEIKQHHTNENFLNIEMIKAEFFKKSQLKSINDQMIRQLWPRFILKYESEIKNDFFLKAKSRNVQDHMIEKAWYAYKEDLIKF